MIIIGIAGGTGSGKTTVVRKIMERLPEGEVGVISQDSYYKDSSHVPVEELKRGEPIEMPTYSYLTCSRQKETVPMGPHDVVLIEGIMALSDSRLRKMMDIKVFVDADGDDRLIRVISRDCIERGRTAQAVIDRYQRVLKPMHQLHIEPTKKFANIIIPEGGNNEVAINLITDYIKGRLTANKK